jgi:hypothetical protein
MKRLDTAAPASLEFSAPIDELITERTMKILDPIAPCNEAKQTRLTLDKLDGKVIGFIDNAKPNFNHLVDDLSDLLIAKYGVASVVKHRKRGQVPVGDATISELAEKCDAVITGSGD